MTRRIRFAIFLILLILFLISAPAVIIYSLGYRINFLEKKLVQTGALFFKTVPSSAEVFINSTGPTGIKIINELTGQKKQVEKKTGFFSGTLFVKNLFPQKYNIQITKQGFYVWEKTLEVPEGLVVEAKDIILIPQSPSFEILAENIINFWFSPDKKRIIFDDSERTLSFYDLEKKSVLAKMASKETGISQGDFLDLIFSPDSKRALLKIESKQGLRYLVLNLETQPLQLSSLDFLGLNIKELSFTPQNPDEIFFVKKFPEGEFIFSAKYVKEEISESPILANFLAYEINGKQMLWLDNQGLLLRTGFFDKRAEYLNPKKPFTIDEQKKYQIISSGEEIFLRQNNDLYYFKKELKEFDKVFDNLNIFVFSPDNKKMVLANNSELWVLFLEDQNYQPYKKAGEKIFLTRFSEKIDQCFWFSGQYLIFTINGKIKIAEIDDRDKININDLFPTLPTNGDGIKELSDPIEKIFFNQFNKKLYILSSDNFYSSETLR